jgi:hypothetical protein
MIPQASRVLERIRRAVSSPQSEVVLHADAVGDSSGAQLIASSKEAQDLVTYLLAGCPAPPPHLLKRLTILQHKQLGELSYKTVVETGTFMGQTIRELSAHFEACFTIELSVDLHKRAVATLADRSNIKCLQGNSASIIPEILAERKGEPILFWLDAHYSGGITAGEGLDPLERELDAILSHPTKDHTILIDDARGLGITHERIGQMVKDLGAFYSMTCFHDIIRLIPQSSVENRLSDFGMARRIDSNSIDTQ